jgi:hypothetical protein
VVPLCSDRISRVPPYSWHFIGITRTGLSPTAARLSKRFRLSFEIHWPDPRSLATTSGVSVDVLSSGYLDVSVPRVRLLSPMYSASTYLHNDKSKSEPAAIKGSPVKDRARISTHRKWVSPFGNHRIKACSQLPDAYRSVPRPSSPLAAKASTECP